MILEYILAVDLYWVILADRMPVNLFHEVEETAELQGILIRVYFLYEFIEMSANYTYVQVLGVAFGAEMGAINCMSIVEASVFVLWLLINNENCMTCVSQIRSEQNKQIQQQVRR